MQIKPEELDNNGYVLIDSLGHKELIPFVRSYLKKRTKISSFYTVSNIIIVVAIIFCFRQNYGIDDFSLGSGITYFTYGMAIAFGLIPLHEFIHVLAYKSQGAKKTSYGANLKKFHFMAIADKFVANKKEFQVVALAPFVVISIILGILLFFVSNLMGFYNSRNIAHSYGFFFRRFWFIKHFEFNNDREIVTYDDKENSISYFYGKIK